MAWLLDADVFISARKRHYGFTFCPAFWDWLVRENEARNVFSIERVRTELLKQTDELSEWTRERNDGFFLSPDVATTSSFSVVNNWLTSQRNATRYNDAALSVFSSAADYFLVAQAHARQFTVVTHEVSNDKKSEIKIPEVCEGLDINCVDPFEMLRTEKPSFVLEPV